MKIRMTIEPKNKEDLVNVLTKKYHFKEEQEDELFRIYEQLLSVVTPYAAYRINHKVTGISVIDDNQSAIVSMTLGVGPDLLQEDYLKKEQLDQAYMLDCIANEMLLELYGEFNKIYARFHRRYVQRYVFIGEEIPLTEIPNILLDIQEKTGEPKEREEEKKQSTEMLVEENSQESAEQGGTVGDIAGEAMQDGSEQDNVEQRGANRDNSRVTKGEISSNSYGVLSPSKSVVFYAILSENPKQACQGICLGCSNLYCENRIEVEEESNPESEAFRRALEQERSRLYLNYGFQRIFGGERGGRRVADGQE